MRFFFKIVGGVLVAFLLLVCIVGMALRTDRVAQKIQEIALFYAKQNQLGLSIGSIQGEIPFHWTIQDIYVQWGENAVFTIKKAKLHFNFFALFSRTLSINDLVLDGVTCAYTEALHSTTQIQALLAKVLSPSWSVKLKRVHLPDVFVTNLDKKKSGSYALDAEGWVKKRGSSFSLTCSAKQQFPSRLCENCELNTLGNAVSLKLRANKELVSGSLIFNHKTAQAWNPFLDLPYSGDVEASAQLRGSRESLNAFLYNTPSDQSLVIHMKADIHQLAFSEYPFLNRPWRVEAQLALWPDASRLIETLKITSDLGECLAQNVQFKEEEIQKGRLSFNFPNLALFIPYFSCSLQGSLKGTACLEEKHMHAEMTSDDLTIADQALFPLTATLQAFKEESVWKGKISLSSAGSSLPLCGESAFDFDPSGTLDFQDILFKAPEAELGGNLKMHLHPLTFEGSLFGYAARLAKFRHFCSNSYLDGSAVIDLNLSMSDRHMQRVRSYLMLKNVHYREWLADEIAVSLQLSQPFHDPKGDLLIEGEKIYNGQTLLSHFSLHTVLDELNGHFTLNTSGSWKERFELSSSGTWATSRDLLSLHFHQFSGFMQNKAFFLSQPFHVVCSSHEMKLENFNLQAGEGSLSAYAELSPALCEIRLNAEHFPLDFIILPNMLLKGGVTFNGYLTATPAHIEGRAHLLLEETTLSQQGMKDPLRTKGTVLAHIGPGNMQIHAEIQAPGGQFLDWSATLPIEYALFPFALRFKKNAPLASELTAEGKLEEIFDFINVGSHRITGLLSTHLFLSKTLENPELLGSIELQDATYENYFMGTRLKKIQARASASHQQINLLSLFASDEKQGSLEAKGSIHLLSVQHYPYSFEIHFDKCHLVHFDTVSNQFSGRVHLDGNSQQALAKGALEVPYADLKIPETLPVDLPILPMTFINEPAHLAAYHLPPGFFFKIDLHLLAKERVYIKGKGLNSEWQGAVHLTGSNMNFQAEGTLTLIKGEYLFAGRVFELTQGEVAFTDKVNLSSYLNLTGTLALQDTTVIAHLRGPLLSPSLILESMPHLPTSSLLSLILFDQDISEISPFQLMQIAQTLVSMSGGAGPDVLESIRKSLGVDRLSIVPAKDGGDAISVQIGKYLIRGVMVTLIQGASSSQIQVEVDLKNGFVLLAETQEEEEGKFTFKWSKNY